MTGKRGASTTTMTTSGRAEEEQEQKEGEDNKKEDATPLELLKECCVISTDSSSSNKHQDGGVVNIIDEDKKSNKIRIEDLGETDNLLFSKLAVAFSSLYVEAKRLENLSYDVILPNVISYGWFHPPPRPSPLHNEEDDDEEEEEAEDSSSNSNAVLGQFAEKLTVLQDSVMFREQLKAVAVNAFRQLEFQYADESVEENRPLSHVNLTIMFETLTKCLAIACKTDEAIASNGHLRRSFQAMKVAIKEALEEQEQEQGKEEERKKKLLALKKTTQTLEFELCSKSCFETIVREITDEENRKSKKNEIEEVPMRLLRALHSYGLEMFEVDFVQRNDIGVLALGVLLVRLEPNSSDTRLIERMFRHIFSENVAGLAVSTGIVIDPLHFLLVQLPESALPSSKKKWQTHLENKILRFNDMNVQLSRIVIDFVAEVTSWTSEFERDTTDRATGGVSLETLTRGVRIARDVKATLELFVHLDNTFSRDASNKKNKAQDNKRRARMRAYGQLAELLETIRKCYASKQNELTLEISQIFTENLKSLDLIVKKAKSSLLEEINLDEQNSNLLRSGGHEGILYDALDACLLGERLLADDFLNFPKFGLLKLIIDVIKTINVKERVFWGNISQTMEYLEIVVDLKSAIKFSCDSSCFFDIAKEAFPAVLRDIYNHPEQCYRLPTIVSAFSSPIKYLLADEVSAREFCKEVVVKSLRTELVERLVQDIETELRETVAIQWKKKASSNVSESSDVNKSTYAHVFLAIPPMDLNGATIFSVKKEVQAQLAKSLYEKAASSLTEWKMYSDIRSIALAKYNLDLSEIDELPPATTTSVKDATAVAKKSSVDVLDVVRDIRLFCVRYNYNMNTQTFIEKSTVAKEKTLLSTLSIQHVSECIRTHGTGVTHAVINSVFRYLAQRFQIFSQFLYEDHVKSLVQKEKQAHSEGKYEEYPVVRGIQFLQEMRKLGVADDGLSFLDQFRGLVTEMGNALGFVRMIRLGTMRYSSKANEFATRMNPEMKNEENNDENKHPNFESLARESGFHDFTVNASKQLDAEIESLRSNSTEGTDYFEVLTNIFSSELQSDTNKHLNAFFLIVPALCLSNTDAMYVSKQKLQKASETIASPSSSKIETQMLLNQSCFTDDGFALGIAYVLKVLNQDSKFDALHWFESCENYYRSEKEAAPSAKKDQEEQMLRLKRIEHYEKEFRLLEYVFTGSRAFFSHEDEV